ncbi:MAG: carbohydrate ABC transporter permease [Chloroflexota bacterium]|nr:carbohydrate ABC transporter permease [Chloroflexota bacterium]
MNRSATDWLKSGIKYIVLLVIIFFVLFPIYWMVATSFKTRLELTSWPPTLIPQNFTWENYQKAFLGRPFPKYMLNSAIVVGISTTVALVIGSLAGYSLARFPMTPRFKQNVSFWILSTRMIPPIVTIIPIFLIFKNLHLLNSYLGLSIVYIGFALPFATWMMRAFIQEVPVDLEEAALVDGDTRLTAFFRIVLPLAAPGLAATAVFSIIVLWNEFLFALILTTTSKTITLPVGIAGLVSQYELLWGEMGAAGTVAIIPILIFALAVQRYLVRGLTMGAVK